jgi:MFS family permease
LIIKSMATASVESTSSSESEHDLSLGVKGKPAATLAWSESALTAVEDEPGPEENTETTPLLKSSRRTDTEETAIEGPRSGANGVNGANGHAAEADDDEDEDPPKSKSPYLAGVSVPRFWLIFSTVLLAYFVACFDGTIMLSSHPVITSYFHGSNSASWLSTSFQLASTVTSPVAGRLSDSFGRKVPFIIMMSIFTLGTLWCALAQSMTSFIIARAICGVGAGSMMSLASMIVSDVIPISIRGTYQAIMNILYGFGASSGAAFGGAMADHLGWRWEFGCQVPPLCVCLVLASLSIPRDLGLYGRTPESWKVAMGVFDFRGAGLLMTALTFLILGLNLGGNVLSWAHPFVIISLTIAALTFPIFVYSQRAATRPIMPLHLISKPPHMNLILSNALASFLTSGVWFNAPLFFQGVLLSTATSSGLRLVVPTIAAALMGAVTGLAMTRTKRMKWPLVGGASFYLVGAAVMAAMRPGWPDFVYTVCLLPSGIAQGLQFPGTMLGVLNESKQEEQAVVSAVLFLWRNIGVVLGIALSSLVVQNGLVHYLNEYVTGPDKDEVIELVRSKVEAIRDLNPEYRGQVVRSYEMALRITFACLAGFAAVSLALVIPLKMQRLRKK